MTQIIWEDTAINCSYFHEVSVNTQLYSTHAVPMPDTSSGVAAE